MTPVEVGRIHVPQPRRVEVAAETERVQIRPELAVKLPRRAVRCGPRVQRRRGLLLLVLRRLPVLFEDVLRTRLLGRLRLFRGGESVAVFRRRMVVVGVPIRLGRRGLLVGELVQEVVIRADSRRAPCVRLSRHERAQEVGPGVLELMLTHAVDVVDASQLFAWHVRVERLLGVGLVQGVCSRGVGWVSCACHRQKALPRHLPETRSTLHAAELASSTR